MQKLKIKLQIVRFLEFWVVFTVSVFGLSALMFFGFCVSNKPNNNQIFVVTHLTPRKVYGWAKLKIFALKLNRKIRKSLRIFFKRIKTMSNSTLNAALQDWFGINLLRLDPA